MTEEEIKALSEKAAQVDKLAQDKENLVNELKELRAKKSPEIDPSTIEAKVNETVEKILSEKSNSESTEARTKSEENFKNKFKEFKSENDPTGLKYDAFKKTLSKMNLSSAKTEGEFMELYEDAYLVLNKKSIKEGTYSTNTDFVPSMGSNPKEADPNNLTAAELKLIREQGITPEKYLKSKAKHPELYRSLLNR